MRSDEAAAGAHTQNGDDDIHQDQRQETETGDLLDRANRHGKDISAVAAHRRAVQLMHVRLLRTEVRMTRSVMNRRVAVLVTERCEKVELTIPVAARAVLDHFGGADASRPAEPHASISSPRRQPRHRCRARSGVTRAA